MFQSYSLTLHCLRDRTRINHDYRKRFVLFEVETFPPRMTMASRVHGCRPMNDVECGLEHRRYYRGGPKASALLIWCVGLAFSSAQNAECAAHDSKRYPRGINHVIVSLWLMVRLPGRDDYAHSPLLLILLPTS